MEDEPIYRHHYRKACITKFIKTYEQEECLWKSSYFGYKNRVMRKTAYKKLQAILKEEHPDVTLQCVIKKIQSLRGAHRKEWHKTLKSKKRIPHLWYYKLMSFLHEEMYKNFKRKISPDRTGADIGQSDSNRSDSDEAIEDEDDYEEIDSIIIKEEEEFINETYDQHDLEIPISDEDSQKYQDLAETTDNIKKEPSHTLEPTAISSNVSVNPTAIARNFPVTDVYDAIGINVAAKLRSLPDQTKIIAEKLIYDVLFKAQIGTLHHNTAVVTPDPFPDL